MKQKDIVVLVIVAIISAIVSFVLSNQFFSAPKDRSQEVETMEAISAEFPIPDKKYFNDQSVNPAQLVEIGTSDHENPFAGSSQ